MAFWSSSVTVQVCIRKLRRCFNRSFVGVCALVLMLGLGACGSDEEKADTLATSPPTTQEDTATGETETQTAETDTEQADTGIETSEPPAETETTTSPEEQQGGAGDEEPARSLALFTGEGGRIRPALVRVPPFISIRVELRSADGRDYGLKFDGKTIKVQDGLSSVSTTLDGLHAGDSIVGVPVGVGTRVRISATAEPGP
jgi:hypothetical protein